MRNDRRHIFNLSSVLISPGLGQGIVNLLTKDWQVGLIFQARSGSPLTPGLTDDAQLTRNPNQRPDIVAGVDPYLDEPVWVPNAAGFNTRLQWINMAAFANPAPGAAWRRQTGPCTVLGSGTPTSRSRATSTWRRGGVSSCVWRPSTSSIT